MKKDLKTEITKEKILKAATEEFALYGFDGATVNQICKKHGISKGLVYHNFKSKEDLYLRCIQNAADEFVSYMSRYEFGTDFKFYMSERYKFFEAHPDYSRLIFAVVLTDNNEFSEKIKNVKRRFDEFNESVYLCAINNIKLRKGVSKKDALEYYSLLQDMLNGYLSGERSSKINFDFIFHNHEKNLERILDFVLYGIAEQNGEKQE
ncbi:MAG: TetR/AcrR family transcriptional regulator [Acutalibacteraceae bacterium]